MAVGGGVESAPESTGVKLADLPVAYAQGYAAPGMLWVETMDFTSRSAAVMQLAAMVVWSGPLCLAKA